MSSEKSGQLFQIAKDQLLQSLSLLKGSAPSQWIMHNRDRLASALNIIWVAGCGYWIFKLITIDVRPQTAWIHITDNPRDALVYLIFGSIGLAFIGVIAAYLIKFLYNLFHDGIQSLLSYRCHSLAKPVSYLLALAFAFSYIEDIKSAGHIAYTQVSQLVHISKQQAIEREIDGSRLLDLLDRAGRE